MIDPKDQQAIREYVSDVGRYSLEAQRLSRFGSLLVQVFPSLQGVADQIAKGRERTVLIRDREGTTTGHLDAWFGYVVIEFKKDLRPGSLKTALVELQMYVSGLWNEHGREPYVCVATDGIEWRTWTPSTLKPAGDTLNPEDIVLSEGQAVRFDRMQPDDIYVWLDRLFLRERKVRPSSAAIRQEFGTGSGAYSYSLAALRHAFGAVRGDSTVQVAFEQWAEYLKFVYGEPATSEELFLTHTYLSVFARFLVHAAFCAQEGAGDVMGPDPEGVLSGVVFERRRLANLHETGLFEWIRRPDAAAALRPAWVRLLARLATFDLSRIDEDVLKTVYQDLVDKDQRHKLGEYYTPDWLATRVVREVLPLTPGVPRVLDPSCGSGTFLRETIGRIREANVGMPARDLCEALVTHVFGFDVHPLAVQFSRATYALAIRDLIPELLTHQGMVMQRFRLHGAWSRALRHGTTA
jgi:hypothetical protein